eukprot:1348513-Prorocentrum_lima.AAC.1
MAAELSLLYASFTAVASSVSMGAYLCKLEEAGRATLTDKEVAAKVPLVWGSTVAVFSVRVRPHLA